MFTKQKYLSLMKVEQFKQKYLSLMKVEQFYCKERFEPTYQNQLNLDVINIELCVSANINV